MSTALMEMVPGKSVGFMDHVKHVESQAIQFRESWSQGSNGSSNAGFSPVGLEESQYSKFQKQQLIRAKRFLNDIREGRKPLYLLKEAMGTSDFPLYFGNIMGREMLGHYQAYTKTYEAIAKIGQLNDFRTHKRYTMDGLRGLMTEVGPGRSPKVAEYTEGEHSIQALVFAMDALIDWRALVNDDLDAFSEIPQDLGIAAARTEQWFATKQYVDASGPHASVYTSGNGNKLASNQPLSMEALKNADTHLRSQYDADGQPILIEGTVLEVPPALRALALDFTQAFQVERLNTSDTNLSAGSTNTISGQNILAPNWVSRGLQVVVNPYIPYIASTANGSTTWFLHAARQGAPRPFLEVSFLRGFNRQPAILRKRPDTEAVFGSLPANYGSFDSLGGHHYRVLHAMGSTTIAPKMSVGSNGSGS